MTSPLSRLLILVVAYNAESTLEKVLQRIPEEVLGKYDTEVLVIDDASTDATFVLGSRFRKQFPDLPLRVLRNTANQGYGGNQKIGYAYAIEEGFDFVALIHGDGQYAPEELPRLLLPLAAGDADAVFGSRMLQRGSALRGGMPLYKYVGNRILTRAQNRMLGSSLSEFHSGYRLYAVSALKRIHFLLDSDGFSFDTEIILQLLNSGARILEVPIPTFYGDEVCHVAGLRYAYEVLRVTAANVAHRAGVLQQRRFDPVREPQELKLGYQSSHSEVLELVPAGAQVLDIGAEDGQMAAALAAKGCQVDVALREGSTATTPGGVGLQASRVDLGHEPDVDVRPYQYLLMLDVLSRLPEPEAFLERLRGQFDETPKTLVLTTANVAFVTQRLMLAAGQFNYGRSGVLDREHVRLYTLRAAKHLLRDAGFRIRVVRGIPAPYPKAVGDNRWARVLLRINQVLIGLSKTVFAYQYLIVAESTPDMRYRLRDTRASETR